MKSPCSCNTQNLGLINQDLTQTLYCKPNKEAASHVPQAEQAQARPSCPIQLGGELGHKLGGEKDNIGFWFN